MLSAKAVRAADLQPSRAPGIGGTDHGPHNPMRDAQNPDILNPPSTDHGTLPNLRFSFSDSHVRQESGGWTRQVTERELGVSKSIAGVNMRLNAGGIRELHWHKEAEWAYMLYGNARITAIDAEGRNFVDDVEVGDLWYFPSGIPHSIQGLGPDGCEFLLVFDSGSFDEDSTFLLSDWFKHIPNEVLAKNFAVNGDLLRNTPDPSQEYIFKSDHPRPARSRQADGRPAGAADVQAPDAGAGSDPDQGRNRPHHRFPATSRPRRPSRRPWWSWNPAPCANCTGIPNTDEWQYYLEGQGRMGVFASNGQARTFDFQAGDVGYVPFAMGHYIENTGTTPLRFLETFKSSYYADLSLNQWLALTPPQLVAAHLHVDQSVINAFQKKKSPVVPA